MKAALITSFDRPPHYGDFPDPTPTGTGEVVVHVLAAGLHQLTRGRAAGLHYASPDMLPFIAGVDGVGRDADGKLRYFAQSPGRIGTMADKTVIELGHSIELPSDSDPIAIAGAMNPAMASWLALRCRVPFRRGQKVLILGATGSSGSMAVQIARHLGASRIIAAGRDEDRLAKLPALGATDVMPLADPRLGALACEVDVVLDLVWGESAGRIMESLIKRRANPSRSLTWIHIGSMAGNVAAIPGSLLRSAALNIVGSGHGAMSDRQIVAELPALAKEIARRTLRIDVKVTPLHDVEQAWSETSIAGERVVFTP